MRGASERFLKKEEDMEVGYDTVVLIDMQEDFIRNLRVGVENLIKNQIKILRNCAMYDIPCAVLEYVGYGSTASVLAEELHSIRRCVTFPKQSNSGFLNFALDPKLKLWGSSRLLLMGINAEYCVRATAWDAIRNGYEIVTAPELISGRPQDDPNDCINWYRENGNLIQV